MKYSLRKIMIIILLLCMLSIISAGTLKHTIYSPLNISIANNSKDYNSKSPITKITYIDNKYNDFLEYREDPGEPYCMLGGTYYVNIQNKINIGGASNTNKNNDLFYCKTTIDLFNNIDIPKDWKNNSLIVYCNDGNSINDKNSNYDYLTSNINSYKVCIIKNTDIKTNNTIISGYEVGNQIIDSKNFNFYNTTTKKGPIINNLKYINNDGNYTSIKEVYIGKKEVPYKEVNNSNSDNENNNGGSHPEPTLIKRNHTEAIEYLKNNSNIENITRIEEINNNNNNNNNLNTNNAISGIASAINLNTQTKTTYHVFINKSFPIIVNKYNSTINNKEFYFHYDQYDKMYLLAQFNTKKINSIKLKNVFTNIPANIRLSRVLLFKKNNNKQIFGYEKSSNLENSQQLGNNIIKPVYIIKLDGFNYNTNKCKNSMEKYNVVTAGIQGNTEIKCDNNQIKIVSKNLDNNDDKPYIGFNIFKNVIMSLK